MTTKRDLIIRKMLLNSQWLYACFSLLLEAIVIPATSFANGSSGFGAESSAWIESNTVRICKAGLHLSVVNNCIVLN